MQPMVVTACKISQCEQALQAAQKPAAVTQASVEQQLVLRGYVRRVHHSDFLLTE